MAVEIVLPASGSTMDGGKVAEWMVKDGEAAVEGAPLFSLDAGGSTNAIAAPATGTLRIVARTGVGYDVGTLLGYIE